MNGTINKFGFVGMAALMHLLVDGICLCSLFVLKDSFSLSNVFSVFLTYNCVAFLSQPFTGIIVDKMKKMHWVLIVALFFLIVAVLIEAFVVNRVSLQTEWPPLLVATLLGIGNSLFHVWGGKQTVLKTGNDMRTLGVFVSTGAFGLALAIVFYAWTLLYMFIICLSLLVIFYIFSDKDDCSFIEEKDDVINSDVEKNYSFYIVLMAITAISLFVMFRSFIGETFSSDITKNNTIILSLGFIAMLGKMCGGWIAKVWGIIKTLVCVLLIVAFTYFIKSSGLSIVFFGVFMINVTMPITLYLANVVMKGKEGFAFGILAAALIPGFLLAHL